MQHICLIGNSPVFLYLVGLLEQKTQCMIAGVVTDNDQIIAFLAQKKIPRLTLEEACAVIKAEQIDILFTADTRFIVPDSLLRKVKNIALNFHNSLLPAYAGVNAPSWALFDGQAFFGCTIHVLNGMIDGGDVIQQAKFKINKNDTAFSLNLKCIEKSKYLLNKIVDCLHDDSLHAMAQPLVGQRTYYSRNDRFGGFGYIDLSLPTPLLIHKINACFTGVNFISEFCIPKLVLNNIVFFVSSFRFVKVKTPAPFALRVHKEDLIIPCADGELHFKDLHNFMGKVVSPRVIEKMLVSNTSNAVGSALSAHQAKRSITPYLAHEKKLITQFCLQPNKLHQSQVNKVSTALRLDVPHVDQSQEALKRWCILFYAYFSRMTNYAIKNIFVATLEDAESLLLPVGLRALTFCEEHESTNMRDLCASAWVNDVFNENPQVTIDFFAKYNFFDLLNTSVLVLTKELAEKIIVPDSFHIAIANQYVILVDDSLRHLFDADDMLAHFDNMLAAMEVPINALDFFSAREKNLLYERGHEPGVDFSHKNFLTTIFANDRGNDYPAIIKGTERESYGSFMKETRAIATHLSALVQQGDRVALVFSIEKNTFEIKVILAILLLGATYVPIAGSEKPERFDAFIQLTHPVAIVAFDAKILMQCRKEYPGIHALSEKALQKKPRKLLEFTMDADSLKDKIAYIIFTSGSTGFPKAVAISYASLNNFIFSSIDTLNIKSHDRMLNFSKLNFDASIWEIFSCFTAKATLVLYAEPRFDFMRLQQCLKHNRVTIMLLPPSILTDLELPKTNDLRAIISGGEACSSKLVKKIAKKCAFYNAYGPTEITVYSSIGRQLDGVPVNMGHQIAGVQMWVMDKYKKILPPHAVGELYISGAGLMKGYFDASTINTQALTTIDIMNQSLPAYATGDLATLSDQGCFSYVGRANVNLVKIRGLRVNLTEVRMVIAQDKDLKQSFVDVCVAENGLITGLICYCVVVKAFNKKNFVQRLQKILPEYALPSMIHVIEAIPLTSNGKVDVEALRLIAFTKEKTFVASTPLSINKELYQTYCKNLNVTSCELNKDFFNLGGDSIKLAKLFLDISTLFKKEISIQQFLAHPCFNNLQKIFNGYKNRDKDSQNINKKFLKNVDAFYETLHVPMPHAAIHHATHASSHLQHKKTFLVTGATGFLGRYIASELALNENFTVYCLVRGHSVAAAEQRLRKKFAEFNLPYHADRIQVMLGDLKHENLGLNDEDYDKLVHSVDKVIHSAYEVLHLSSYHNTESVNVDATFRLIKFSFTGKIKTFDFMSTVAVVFQKRGATDLIEESEFDVNHLKKGCGNEYLLGKIHSELALYRAVKRGLPVNIFRLAWVTGASNDGSIDPAANHRLLLLKTCIELGVAPQWDMRFSIVPVDIVAKVIAKLHVDEHKRKDTGIFHVIGDIKLEWVHLMLVLVKRGYKIKLIDESAWIKIVQRDGANTSLLPLLPIYSNAKSLNKVKPLLSITNVKQGNFAALLKKYDVEYPVVNSILLDKYISYLEKIKFLPGISA